MTGVWTEVQEDRVLPSRWVAQGGHAGEPGGGCAQDCQPPEQQFVLEVAWTTSHRHLGPISPKLISRRSP